MFGVTWVQLSQLEDFFPLHLLNPHNCVDSEYSKLLLLRSRQCTSSIPPFVPPVLHSIDWTRGRLAPEVQSQSTSAMVVFDLVPEHCSFLESHGK